MTDSLTVIDCDYVQPSLACAYLRVSGAECAFIETNTSHAVPKLLDALRQHRMRPEDVRYVIITHVHLDHAGGASALLSACPNATLLAHPRAARHAIDPSRLIAGATAVYGPERFASLYGSIAPIDPGRVRALDDNTEVSFGNTSLKFFHTRGHANHHFVVFDPAVETVFTGDAFGLVYPRLQSRGLLAFPSTSPTDFDGPAAHASIDKIVSLGTPTVSLTHFGQHTEVNAIAAQLHDWLSLSEELLCESKKLSVSEREAWLTVKLTEAFDRRADTLGLTLDQDCRALVEFDRALNAQGLAFAANRSELQQNTKHTAE